MSVDCIVLSSTHEGCKNQAEVRDPSTAHALPPLLPLPLFSLKYTCLSSSFFSSSPSIFGSSGPTPFRLIHPFPSPIRRFSFHHHPSFLCEPLSASHLGLVGPACDQSLKTLPDLSHLRMATCCIFFTSHLALGSDLI